MTPEAPDGGKIEGDWNLSWRRTKRRGQLKLGNVREMSYDDFDAPPGTFTVLVDYPWDEPGHTVDEDRLRATNVRNKGQWLDEYAKNTVGFVSNGSPLSPGYSGYMRIGDMLFTYNAIRAGEWHDHTYAVRPESMRQYSHEHVESTFDVTPAELWLHVTPHGFRVHKTMLSGESRPLAQHLARSGIVELLLKRGVTRYELERCVAALHEGTEDRTDSVLTRLWEASLRHVVFRSADECLGAQDARRDLEGWRAEWPAGCAAEEHEALLGAFRNAAIESAASWQSLVALTRSERASLDRLRLAEPEDLAERLARHLASLHDREREAVRRGESLGLLGDVVEMLVAQRKFQLAAPGDRRAARRS